LAISFISRSKRSSCSFFIASSMPIRSGSNIFNAQR
jgi:hypothetical protein